MTPVEIKQLRQRIIAAFPWAESPITAAWLDDVLPCDLQQLRSTMDAIDWASGLEFGGQE